MGIREKPIEISQGFLGVAVPSPSPKREGEGTATRRVFINATSKLVTKLQATCDWLIQHSNRIFKLSGLSSKMEMLD